MKGYTFDNCISTDGVSVSIRFLNNKYVEQEKIKRKKLKIQSIELYKNLNIKEIQEIKNKSKNKIKYEEKKKEFKKLSKEDKKKITNNRKEFKYLDELSEDKLNEIKIKKRIYVDPGLRSIFYMIDDNKKIFNYTNKQRVKETKRLK